MKKISIPVPPVRLEGGILAHRAHLNTENLMKAIDPHELADVYTQQGDGWFAEPEFAGQYVDALVQHYRRHGEDDYLERARIVVESAIRNQRDDGYLGCYRPGLEFDENLSVWNQAFTIKGLVSYYEVTGDEASLTAARRSADFIAGYYLSPGARDILRTINQGLEHTAILQQIVRLYRLTGARLYLDFANFIVRAWEESNIKFITGPIEYSAPLFMMGAMKAIESLICYHGILELYEVTGEPRYLTAAERYWEVVRSQQINIVGCGAITELWVHNGGKPANLPIDVHPNETCVAWGWARLSMMLFQLTGKAKYIDAIEQSLYNHILGAQAADGSDFSYYQGLVGRKVHEKKPWQYSCCRYRGLHFLAYVPDFVMAHDETRLFINLFCPSSCDLPHLNARARIRTAFPRSGGVDVEIEVSRDREFEVLLRVPAWCEGYEVRVDGDVVSATVTDGYFRVSREWRTGTHRIALALEMTVKVQRANVDHRDSVGVTYGPLCLAIDERYGTPIHATAVALTGDELDLRREPDTADEHLPIVRFTGPGTINGEPAEVTLVDYASAGSAQPNHDEFKVWIPVVAD